MIVPELDCVCECVWVRLSRLCVRMSVLCESEWCETFDENVNSLLFFLIRLVLNNPPESKIFNSKNNKLSPLVFMSPKHCDKKCDEKYWKNALQTMYLKKVVFIEILQSVKNVKKKSHIVLCYFATGARCLKMVQKVTFNVYIWEFLKTWSLRLNSVTRSW